MKTAITNKKAGNFTRRIGSTTYRVGIHFSNTSSESMNDKVMRLIKNEAVNGKERDNEK